MKHIVNFSGGKDSTAMLLLMLENDYPIDEIIFCDTTKEFPEIYQHINDVEKYIGMEITKIIPEKSFEYYLYDHIKTRGKYAGEKGYGWPTSQTRWCTAYFKRDNFNKYINKKYGSVNNIIQYRGIALDEIERFTDDELVRFPLIDYGFTEPAALQYCYDHGFDFGGVYKKMYRASCWCCPFSKIKELRNLYMFYPDLWNDLKDMDNKSYNKFRKNYSVEDLEQRFKKELQGVYYG